MMALDLFCGAGGASMGLHRAGFEVVGIDIRPQRNYPFTFIQADALAPPVRLDDFDFVWASPPCQAYSAARTIGHSRHDHHDLIPQTRKMLTAAAKTWAIENVKGAPLGGTMLCGGSFDELGVKCHDGIYRHLARHRIFETSFFMLTEGCRCDHRQKIGVYGGLGPWDRSKQPNGGGGYMGSLVEAKEAMMIDWMCRSELVQSIPPAYSEFIARAAMEYIDASS